MASLGDREEISSPGTTAATVRVAAPAERTEVVGDALDEASPELPINRSLSAGCGRRLTGPARNSGSAPRQSEVPGTARSCFCDHS